MKVITEHVSSPQLEEAVRTAARAIQHNCARKPLLPRELAEAVVFYDTVGLIGGRALLDELRALPDSAAYVLEVIRDARP